MPTLPQGAWLAGTSVRLSPVIESDLPALAEIMLEPEVYASGFLMWSRPGSLEEALHAARAKYLDVSSCDGQGRGRVAYAVRLIEDSELGSAGELVGTSSLAEAWLSHERVHLGWTMYHPRTWGTTVNPETKYLLLRHCFEELGYGRVKMQTDAVNHRSVAALTKLGATREGVLRRHSRREDGTFRDTVVFSVIAEEWPQVRDRLQARLGG